MTQRLATPERLSVDLANLGDRRLRTRRRHSFRAATVTALILPNSSSGRTPALTSKKTKAPGASRSAGAWVPHSTTAGAANAYVLTKRGTWIHFKNKNKADPVQSAVLPERRAGISGSPLSPSLANRFAAIRNCALYFRCGLT